MNPHADYVLWVIMMRQCGLINCNNVQLWWGDVGNRGGHASVGGEDIGEISVPSQFGCEPKTALKKIL